MLHPLGWFALIFFVLAILLYLIGTHEIVYSIEVGRCFLFVFLTLATIFGTISITIDNPSIPQRKTIKHGCNCNND
jgi:hypothetical protein